jgi:exodeoxyribonuclease VII large subunit
MESWKRSQNHYQSQLEMLNPQRTLERGYAVILTQDKEAEKDMLQAVRNPKELKANESYQVRLAEGEVEIEVSKVGH